jgi:hypothetical protein
MKRGRVRSQLGDLWRGRDVAVVYAVLVVVVSVVAATQPPSLLRDIVHTSSTSPCCRAFRLSGVARGNPQATFIVGIIVTNVFDLHDLRGDRGGAQRPNDTSS